MALNPHKDLKLFYSIGEVAKLLEVKESLLRYWEKEFAFMLKPQKSEKGTRQYRKEDLETIKLIHYLVKIKGMTLPGAKQQLKENRKGVVRNAEIADKLQAIKEELLQIKKELENI